MKTAGAITGSPSFNMIRDRLEVRNGAMTTKRIVERLSVDNWAGFSVTIAHNCVTALCRSGRIATPQKADMAARIVGRVLDSYTADHADGLRGSDQRHLREVLRAGAEWPYKPLRNLAERFEAIAAGDFGGARNDILLWRLETDSDSECDSDQPEFRAQTRKRASRAEPESESDSESDSDQPDFRARTRKRASRAEPKPSPDPEDRFVSPQKLKQRDMVWMDAELSRGRVLVIDCGWAQTDHLLRRGIDPERIVMCNNNAAHFAEMERTADDATERNGGLSRGDVFMAPREVGEAANDDGLNDDINRAMPFSVLNLDLCCKPDLAVRTVAMTVVGRSLPLDDHVVVTVTMCMRGICNDQCEGEVERLHRVLDGAAAAVGMQVDAKRVHHEFYGSPKMVFCRFEMRK